MVRPLVVKITHGPEAMERLNQGVTVAATAANAGAQVSLWLTGEAVWLAVPGRAEQWHLAHAPSVADLRDDLLATASITVCGQCAARRELGPHDLLSGVTIKGAASFVGEVLAPDVQALVY